MVWSGEPSCSQTAHTEKVLATGKGRVPVEKRLSWQARGGRVR